jgi:hypothetical protein
VERLTNRKLAHLDDLIELRLALYAKQLLADDAAATVPPLALKPHDGQLAETDVAPGTGLPGITTAEPGGRAPGR